MRRAKALVGSSPTSSALFYSNPMPFFRKRRQPPLASFEDVQRELDGLRKELARASDEISALREALRSSVRRVGIVRFNPFREIGGDQSFSIALLNEENSGVVVTSHYGRDMNRVYAKPVSKGSSSYLLSKEEEEAIKSAEKNGKT